MNVYEKLRATISPRKTFEPGPERRLPSKPCIKCEPFTSHKRARRNVNKAIEHVAQKLGNTVAVCKKSYIHPAVFEAYLAGNFRSVIGSCERTIFSKREQDLLRLLKDWAKPKINMTMERVLVGWVRLKRKKASIK
jgi:hypothetical protein